MKVEERKMLKKVLLCMLLVLIPVTTFAGTAFNKIVVFGDSLSDNGNLYAMSFHKVPKSPPYYNGIFSNGLTWAQIAEASFSQSHISLENYAVGGEPALFHNPLDGFLPITLSMSMDDYLIHHLFSDKSTTLFIFWIGSNDYLNGSKNADADTTAVVNKITEEINSLISKGGKNFLIMGEPDLGLTPMAAETKTSEIQHELAMQHNKKLLASIEQVQTNHPDIVINYFDIYALFHDLLQNPEKYNQIYHTHFSNTTDACWQGGYSLRERLALQQAARTDTALIPQHKTDKFNFANYVANTPALMDAYTVGKEYEAGQVPCGNPEEHIFWDHVHPTASIHSLFAIVITDYIKQHYTMA